jgi:hypothetical protein
MATREEIKSIIAYMALVFPNYKPDISSPLNTVDVFTDLLGDLPIDTLKTAAKACCAEPGRAFAPSAGEIRGMATQFHIKAAGVPQTGEAWQEVMDAIKYGGCHYGTPEFSHPLVKKAVQAIGFEAIGMSEDVMVERATEDAAMIPEAVKYIEQRRQIGDGIKLLTDKWTVKP